MAKKKLRVWLENLGMEVPVYQLDKKNQMATILVSDVPVKIARNAGLTGKTVKYWYGENAGGNRLVDPEAETPEEKAARETVEAIASNIETLANGVRKILEGRLNKRAIVLLLSSASGGMNKEVVERVLNAVASLDKTFLK